MTGNEQQGASAAASELVASSGVSIVRPSSMASQQAVVHSASAPDKRRRKARMPRPESIEDLEVPEGQLGLDAADLLQLLQDPDLVRWRAGDRSPTHLALAQGWVIKTDILDRKTDLAAVRQQQQRAVRRARKLRIWHPHKTWFLLRDGKRYWPCSATPWLEPLGAKGRSWADTNWQHALAVHSRRLVLILRSLRYGRTLDMQLDNFGLATDPEHTGQLFYIDDEVYSVLLKRVY